jgi:hypothetical protein
MRSGAVFWPCPRWWFGLLTPACLLLCSCATLTVSPAPDGAATLPGDTVETREPPPASETIERRAISPPDAGAHEKEEKDQNENPRYQRERLERRLQAVVTCLEETRQAVVAAEVAGAGIETVRPAIDALNRSEAALREAQAQLIHGDVAQAASPLDTAEAECRAAREFSHQTSGAIPDDDLRKAP